MANRDYEEFVACLNGHGARYLVVGAHAVAFHARPRATKDFDIYIEPTPSNAPRVIAAVKEFFGVEESGLSIEDLLNPDAIIQFGVAPVRIDLLTRLDGIHSFAEVWKRRVDAKYGAVDAHYIS